jgi:hypothetical protein
MTINKYFIADYSSNKKQSLKSPTGIRGEQAGDFLEVVQRSAVIENGILPNPGKTIA